MMQDNSEVQKNPTQSTMKKTAIFSYLKNTFSKQPLFTIVFWVLSSLSIVAILILVLSFLQNSFSSSKASQEIIDFSSAKSDFEKRTGTPDDWFKVGVKLPDTLLFVNTNVDNHGNKTFICIANGNKSEFSFTDIPNTSYAGKQINDTIEFDSFITQFLSVEETDNIDTLAEKIGAQTTYIENIKRNYPLTIKNQRDVIFSLIYNTIVGNPKGHIAVAIENKKLKILTADNFVWDRIDKEQFVKSMNQIVNSDTLNIKDKYIIATSNKLHSNNQANTSNNIENKFQQYFNNDKVIRLNCKLPINVLYYDFRKDVLHIGKDEFSITDERTKQYLPRLKSSPKKVFYLVENDTSLNDLSNYISIDDKIVWGKIDSEKLEYGKFTSYDYDFTNDFRLIKTWGKPFLLYLAIFILLLQIFFSVFYWFFNNKKQSSTKPKNSVPEEEQIIIDGTLLTEEKTASNKLKRQIEDYEEIIKKINKENATLNSENTALKNKIRLALVDFQGLPATGKECVEAVLKAYDKVLGGNSLREFEKTLKDERISSINEFKEEKNFETIKEQSDFYKKIIESKRESDLLKVLDKLRDELRKNNIYLPEIQSLKKTYNDLVSEKNGEKDEIITALLTNIDEYAIEREKLLPQFKTYKEQTKEYHQIKPTFVSTQKQVSDFYILCSRLQKKDVPNLWDRTALSVWAITELAIPLLEIWDKRIWFEDKSNNISELLKSDVLQIFTTRNFLGDFEERKSLDDFKNTLNLDIPEEISKYNNTIAYKSTAKLNSIDEDLKSTLTEAFDRIRKFDATQDFIDKMWDNFVKDFLKNAPNINSDEDKAWFFKHLFNITYHTADFLDFIKNNKGIIYCYNYQFLHNNFDLSNTPHYEFQRDHIDKSTRYSNLVYKWADELNIQQLKVLVGKYMIKP